MKIKKLIDRKVHEVEFVNITQLEKKLINDISNLDILIFDRSIIKNRLVKKLLSKFSSRSLIIKGCLLYTSPSPRDLDLSRMPSSA